MVCYAYQHPDRVIGTLATIPLGLIGPISYRCAMHTGPVRLELWRELLEPLDASVHLNNSADEHLPAGADYPWTTWKALNQLRTQVGRSRVNMSKWGYSNETETCDCDIRQTMQHLLVFPMMDTACSTQDLATANGIAIGCARHWEGTI